MPTPMEFVRAANAAKQAGDAEAAAFFHQKATEAYQAEAPKATEGMSGTAKLRAGIGQGMTNVARQAGNILGVNSDEMMAQRAAQDRALLDTGAGKVGSFIGEMAATAPVGGLAGGAAKAALGRAGVAAGSGLRAATMAAAQGGAEGGLTAGPGNRGLGAAAGAAGGVLIPGAAGWVGKKLSRGVEPTSAAKLLMRQDVDLTPGQMNPRSALGQVEGASKSLPGVGGIIEEAQARGAEGFRNAARARGAAPGGPTSGSLDDIYAGYGPAYGGAKGFPVESSIMAPHGTRYPGAVDLPLVDYPKNKGAFSQAISDRSLWATGDQRKQAGKWIAGQAENLPGRGKIGVEYDSAELLKLRSNIRDRVRAFRQMTPTPESEAQVSLLHAAEQRVTDALESRLPKKASDALRATDAKYRSFKQVENATTAARGRGSEAFTPTELARQANKSDDPEMWKLANAGKRVLDAGPPPTGARALTWGVPAVVAGAAGFPVVGPLATLATVGALAGTKGGRKLAGGMTKPQQLAQAASAALRRKAGRTGRSLGKLYTTGAGAELLDQFYGEK